MLKNVQGVVSSSAARVFGLGGCYIYDHFLIIFELIFPSFMLNPPLSQHLDAYRQLQLRVCIGIICAMQGRNEVWCKMLLRNCAFDSYHWIKISITDSIDIF